MSAGYLRNYLAPAKLAQNATPLRSQPSSGSASRPRPRPASRRSARRRPSALLSKTVLTISHRAGEDGRLFGSVTAKEIADAVRQARGLHVDHRKVRLEEPIRELGTHMVEIEVSEGVTASVKTMVVEEK